MNDYRINGKRALKDIQAWFRLHLMPFFGGRRMASTTTADVRAYFAKRQADTVSVRTAHEVVAKDGTVRRVPEQRRSVTGVSNGEVNPELTALKRASILARPRTAKGGFFCSPRNSGPCSSSSIA